MKKTLAYTLALLLMLPSLVLPQAITQVVEATLVANFDPTTDTHTYVVFGGANATISQRPYVSGVLGPGTPVSKPLETTGSSTTVTAVTANAPLQGRAAGDLLIFPNVADQEEERTIATFTNANSITVNAAIDLDKSTADDGTGAGYTFRFKKRLTGTAATDGWFAVDGFRSFQVQFTVATLNATSLDGALECRASQFAAAHTVDTHNFTAVGSKVSNVTGVWDSCRVGWSFNTDAGVQSVNTYFIGVR